MSRLCARLHVRKTQKWHKSVTAEFKRRSQIVRVPNLAGTIRDATRLVQFEPIASHCEKFSSTCRRISEELGATRPDLGRHPTSASWQQRLYPSARTISAFLGLVVTRSYRLYDPPEITTWSSDRITLLGDAAHAMRPLLGQGANQAIIDADELARQLLKHDDISVALKAYADVREPFTNALKRAAKQFAPQYAKVFAAGKQD